MGLQIEKEFLKTYNFIKCGQKAQTSNFTSPKSTYKWTNKIWKGDYASAR